MNRKGRPRSFDALRALGQQIAHEQLDMADGTKRTAVEVIMRKLAAENPERFLEIAFGKVPQPVEHSGNINVSSLSDEELQAIVAGKSGG